MKKGEIVESWETSGVKETEWMKTMRKWVNVNKKTKQKWEESEVVSKRFGLKRGWEESSGAPKPESAKIEPGYDSPDTVLGDAWGRTPITSILCEVTTSEVSKRETHGGCDGPSGASKPEFAKIEPGYDSPDTVLEDAWGRVCQ